MLTWFAQEQTSSCVAACVRMVLSGFSVNCTEEQVRHLLGNPRLGISLWAAQDRLSQATAELEFHDDWGLDDLREALNRGSYPIVGVERHILGHLPARHAVVPISITSQVVKAFDPAEGPHLQECGLEAFEMAWNLAGQEALLITTPPRF